MSPDDFAKLEEKERSRISQSMEEFHERLHKLLHQFPRWRREMQARIKDANRDTMRLTVGHMIEELRENYADLPNVLAFLEQVHDNVIEAGEELREQQKPDAEGIAGLIGGVVTLQRYQVNLLVDNGGAQAAPVIFEDNPTLPNLIGRFDHIAHLGTVATNFMMIRGGALHRANGGYLTLDIAKLLGQPFAYESLKRALKSRQIRIESLAQMFGWVSTQPLEPEAIPLDVMVVLFGERLFYYLLREYDPEFEDLFKIAADFESDAPRSAENTRLYARLIATLAREHQLRPLDRNAVARVIEHGARVAADAEKLSARGRRIGDLLREADHRAAQAGHELIVRDDVEAALAGQRRRSGRLRDELNEHVLRETLLISTQGAHVGQINALAVIDLGDTLIGHPVRITATARIGEGDVIDIEREAELGGAIHTKGVMILSSFLAARYSRTMPLSLAASLVFEQSYGPVEGDSASLAELCALLSALAGAPICQALAVTGSVNQFGTVQAIGGVNEKIEGFFEICRARGLDGENGVIIPQSNVKHLMLRRDVVEAAEQGKFHVWPVADVDQAIELLTGVPAGVPDEKGVVPPNTINYLVAAQLAEMSLLRREFSGSGKSKRRRKERE
jgi:lon-related putative ATP-dependent protease